MAPCPCDTLFFLSQLEEQSDQVEKLRRELEAKAGELVRVQESLSRTEQVWRWRPRAGRDGGSGPRCRGVGPGPLGSPGVGL